MSATPKRKSGCLKVAYADDHVAVRKGIIAYLQEAEDIKVIIEADNGRELVQKIAAAKEEKPCICIVDMQMPEMNGLETVLAIRKKWPEMKFLVLSVYDDERYVMQMVRAGVGGYLSKSDNPDKIKKALWEIQEKGIYQSELLLKSTLHSAQNSSPKPVSLSARELTVLKYCCSDLTYTQIAEKMKCTLKSVEGHRDSICRKLNIRSRSGMVLYAIQSGLVPVDTNSLFT